MSRTVSFFTVPVSFVDDNDVINDKFHGFDILLPVDKSHVIEIVSWIIKLRSEFLMEKNINRALANFFDNQPYSCFNYVYISQPESSSDRLVTNGLTHMIIENEKIPLSDNEERMVDLAAKICYILMNVK